MQVRINKENVHGACVISNILTFSSRKNNCPMFIRFALTSDGQFLQVADLCLMHNHSLDENKHYPFWGGGTYQSYLG